MDERLVELEAEVVRLRAERDAAVARAAALEGSVATSPICMWCTSGETGRYLFVNEAFAALFGRTVEEALNADALQDWFICTHPDDRDLEHAAIMRLASGEIDRFQI